jgi:hypothetical protein
MDVTMMEGQLIILSHDSAYSDRDRFMTQGQMNRDLEFPAFVLFIDDHLSKPKINYLLSYLSIYGHIQSRFYHYWKTHLECTVIKSRP